MSIIIFISFDFPHLFDFLPPSFFHHPHHYPFFFSFYYHFFASHTQSILHFHNPLLTHPRSRDSSDDPQSLWNDRLKQNITQQHYSPNPSIITTQQLSSSSSSSSISSFSSQTSMNPPSNQTAARSRARAGTLPSRLPPGLPIASNTHQQPPMGSLALLSPDSSSVPSHVFPQHISQTSPSSSSTARLNASLHSSASNSNLNYSQQFQQQRLGIHPQASSSTSSLPNASNLHTQQQPYDSYRSEIPFITIPSHQQHQQQLQQHQLQQQNQSLSATSVSRLRSGSLNVLSDSARQSLYSSPFGSSIWSSQRSSHLQPPTSVETKRASQTSLLNALDEGSIQESEPVESQVDQSDPLQPFYKELSRKIDPSRMRSYTVNNLPYGLPTYDTLINETPNEITEDHYVQHHLQQQQKQQHQQVHQHQHHIQKNSSPESQPSQLRPDNLLHGNRPRAQTTVGSFDPPFTMGNASSLRSIISSSSKNNSQINYFIKDPMSHNIIINSIDDTSIGPTRSLWLGNIPASTTSFALNAIFSSYGTVESARVLPHKNCGFVNFVSIDSAIQAKNVLNGKELFTGNGPCRVGFAKVVDSSEFENEQVFSGVDTINSRPSDESVSVKTEYAKEPSPIIVPQKTHTEPQLGNIEYSVTDKDVSGDICTIESNKSLEDIAADMGSIVTALGATESEKDYILASINRALEFKDFETDISSVPEPRPDRVYDAPTLREVRKKIDGGLCSQNDIEEIALDILDEIAELSSDYVGNTVVQKLFDSCSEPIKDMMLKQIAPYLAQISIHKNGTWAAQKIIGVAGTKRQIDMIARALHPYTVHLFLDQFGNYAIQCCLQFEGPWNDFIFETMLSRFWDIAQGRYGARAMRACLESHHVSREQQRMLAAAITMHAVQLATNANGALLLTWYLDTYTAANRHSILAPKLIPNLVQLCTHKLACLTVLKVINYKTEPSAREEIFNALFNPGEEQPSRVLEQILNHSHGPTFIYKIISTPFLEGPDLQNAVSKIRAVLIAIKALPAQGYKRLMDEVGLSTRNAPGQPSGNTQQSNLHRNNSTNNRIYQQQSQIRSQLTPQRTHSTGSNFYQSSQMHVPQMEVRYGRSNGNNNLGSYMSNKRNGNGVNGGGYYNGGNNNDGLMNSQLFKPSAGYDQFGQLNNYPHMSPNSQYDYAFQQQMEQLNIGRSSPNKFVDSQGIPQQPYQMPPPPMQQWPLQQQQFYDPSQKSPGQGYIQPQQQYYEKR